MASLNKAQIIGRLGRDPDVRYTGSGDAICNITVATTESWKDKDGNKKEATEWHKVVLYRKLGEIAGQYLKKGSEVYIEGRIKTRKWQDKDGNDRYTTEIEATELQMFGGRDNNGSSDQRTPRSNGGQQQPTGNRQPQNAPSGRSGGGGNGDDYGQFGEDIPFLTASFMAEPMLRSRSRRV